MKNIRSIEAVTVIIVLATAAALYLAIHTRQNQIHHEKTECLYNLRSLYSGYNAFLAEHRQFTSKISTNEGGTMEYVDMEEKAYLHFRNLVRSYITPASLDYPPIDTLICPRDKRSAAPLGSVFNTNISYFLSLNPPEDRNKWILAGNRNLSLASVTNSGGQPVRQRTWNPTVGLHGDTGYLLLLDGSVNRYSSADVSKLFDEAGNSTNHLAIP